MSRLYFQPFASPLSWLQTLGRGKTNRLPKRLEMDLNTYLEENLKFLETERINFKKSCLLGHYQIIPCLPLNSFDDIGNIEIF